MLEIGGWPVGAFRSSSGEYVYCVEPGAVEPSGAQKSARTVSSLPAYSAYTFDQSGWKGTVTSGALSGKRLRQINYVLWEHGRTKSKAKAVAVQLAVWMLRGDPGAEAWLDHHLGWVRANGGKAYIDRARELVAEAQAQAVVAVAPKPKPLRIEPDEADPTTGTVAYPAGTTELRIDGGAFDNGGELLKVSGGKAGRATWTATPHDEEWQGEQVVSITGNWKLKAAGWPAKVSVQPPVVALQQRLAAGIGPVTSTFSGRLSTTERTDIAFEPVLSTLVEERMLSADGDRFSDTVEFEIADGSAPWPSREGDDGQIEYAPVLAQGTVYGPFEAPQEPGDDVPDDAPTAGDAAVIAEHGPGEYRVESTAGPTGPGYYYWVWRIREEEQTAELREADLLPQGYDFSDDFGLVDEGHVVPTGLRWDTELEERVLDAGDAVLRDRLTVEPHGGVWLRDESGDRIPAVIRLTVYGSDTEPARAATAPEDARRLTEARVEVDRPVDGGVVVDPIELPSDTRGWVTVQACLYAEDQPERWRGYTEEWCDDYGIPEETARISEPEQPGQPEEPARPDDPELALTGSDGDSMLSAGVPLVGLGLLGSGAGALLLGGLLRQRSRGGARHYGLHHPGR
ncbi:hypothetical protein LEUCIP111803_00461 [Leucobacter soli]|uniref:Uncharacterized protein n=2 Tax=Leucobacter soli TaxID=2812850 RepID=A0A916JTQ1_9MICO|nr:hypothetical protein LEUCIP111803_00461 [Leucobacter soli]